RAGRGHECQPPARPAVALCAPRPVLPPGSDAAPVQPLAGEALPRVSGARRGRRRLRRGRERPVTTMNEQARAVGTKVRKLLPSPVSTPDAIVRVLEEAGIEYVFGMPGGKTIPIFNALYDHQSTIRTVLVREEGQAAVMADVYGRLTGKPGVTMGQGAFMLTNAGMGLVEAYLAGSPVLVLSELSDHAPFSHHAPYQAGTGDYGTWNAAATIAGYTKQVFVAREGSPAVHQTQPANKNPIRGPPRPRAR